MPDATTRPIDAYRTAVSGGEEGSAAEAKAWVEENADLVGEAFRQFLTDGEWPEVQSLQRYFDRVGPDIDVQAAAGSKPRVRGEMRPLYFDRLILQVRHLMWLPGAQQVVKICIQIIQRGVQSYLSDDDPPIVRSGDLLVASPTEQFTHLDRRAEHVLRTDAPSIYGGGNSGDNGWAIVVDTRNARRLRGIDTAAGFVARQDEIRREEAEALAAVSSSGIVAGYDAAAGPWTAPDWRSATSDEAPLLFLSWSQPRSRAVAKALQPILQQRLNGVEVFFSPTSIEPGADPSRRLFEDSLLRARALVVVLTKESVKSSFVIWEAAAAWARKQLVVPLFVDVEPADVPRPMPTRLQGVHLYDRMDMDRGLVQLGTPFDIHDVGRLTDGEYEALLAAAGPH